MSFTVLRLSVFVIPVYNEAETLEKNMIILHNFLNKNCDFPWYITVFSNGSTDKTVTIGNKLSKRYKRINFSHTSEKGKAKALRRAWQSSKAQIVGFMDADLSTELDAFPKCVKCIVNDKADIAIGNRFAPESKIERSLFREFLSRGYSTLIRIFFPRTAIRDAPCGFKFLRSTVSRKLLPHIENESWFFDSELLLLAEQAGYNIAQVPVRWTERKKSTVKIVKVVTEYTLNLLRMRLNFWFGNSQK